MTIPLTDPSNRGPGRPRKYTDDALVRAIAASHSWRGVLRILGLANNPGAMIRSVRRRADHLRIDYSHFTGPRGWHESDLAAAVADSDSWSEVAQRLGLAAGGTNEQRLRGHARRLSLDTSRLDAATPVEQPPLIFRSEVQLDQLRRAGSTMAATWFMLRGYDVAWPLEPCRYDLLVMVNGTAQRIQVKTTQTRAGCTWALSLSTSTRTDQITYDPDEIDFFFAIDGDFTCYLIPVEIVGGLGRIHLAAYAAYELGPLIPSASQPRAALASTP